MSLNKRCDCPTSPKCEHVWHYAFTVNHQRYRASTETADKHKARDIEAKERARILDGKHGIRRQADIDISFRSFAKEYIDAFAVANVRPRTLVGFRSIEKTLNGFFGGLLLREITPFHLEQFKSKRLAARPVRRPSVLGLKASTVNHELSILKAILNKAVLWKRLTVSPGAAVRMLKDRARRTRILTSDEQRRLVQAAGETPYCRHVQPVVEMLLITGARQTELLSVRWEDCQGGQLRFIDTKGGRPRSVPITPRMAEILNTPQPVARRAFGGRRGTLFGQRRHCDFVFTQNAAKKTRLININRAFASVLKVAGITTGDVTLHTLRHTALSRMMNAGIDPRTIMDISGHQSMGMLQRYTHPTEQRKVDALSCCPDDHAAIDLDETPELEKVQQTS